MDNSTQQTPSGGPNPRRTPRAVNGNQYPFSHNVYSQSPPISSTAMPPSRQPQAMAQSSGPHTFNMGMVPQYLPPANKNAPLDHHVALQGGPGGPAHQAMAPTWNVPARPQTSHPVTNSNFSTQYVPTNISPVGRQTPGHVSNTNSPVQYMPPTPPPLIHPGMYPGSPGPQFMPDPRQVTPQPTPTPGSVPPGIQRPRPLSASNGQAFAQNYGPIINGHLMPPSSRPNGYTAGGASPQVPGRAFTGGHSSPQLVAPGNSNRTPRPASAVPRPLASPFNLPSNAQVAPRAVQSTIATPAPAVDDNTRQGSSMHPTGTPPTSTPPASMSSTNVPPTGTPPTGTPPTGTPSTSAPPASAPPTVMPSTSAPSTGTPSTSAPPTGVPPRPSIQTPSAGNQATMGTTAKRAADQNLPQQPAKKQRKTAAPVSATYQPPPATSVQRPGSASASASTSAARQRTPASLSPRPLGRVSPRPLGSLSPRPLASLSPRRPKTPDEPMHLPQEELDEINTPYVIEPEVGEPVPKGKTALAWEQAVQEIEELVKEHVRPGKLIHWQVWYRLKHLSNAMEQFIARPGRRKLTAQEPVDLLDVRYIRVIEDGIMLDDFPHGIPNRSHAVYRDMFKWAKEREVNKKWAENARKRREAGPSPREVAKQIYKWDKLTGSGSTPASREGPQGGESSAPAELAPSFVRHRPKPAPRQEPQNEEPREEEESYAPGAGRSVHTHKARPWWQEGLPPK